jgi:hypothetical protein
MPAQTNGLDANLSLGYWIDARLRSDRAPKRAADCVAFPDDAARHEPGRGLVQD